MKKTERRFLRFLMSITAIILWLEGLLVIVAPLGYLNLVGVDAMANSVYAGVRVFGVLFIMMGVLAWDAARKPPKHIGIASLLAVFFLTSAAVRAGSMTLEGEIGSIANPIIMTVEVVFGLAHAGWYYLWSDRPTKK